MKRIIPKHLIQAPMLLCLFVFAIQVHSGIVVEGAVTPPEIAAGASHVDDPIVIGDFIIGADDVYQALDGHISVVATDPPTSLHTLSTISIGQFPRAYGELNVIGNGAPGSARVSMDHSVYLGGDLDDLAYAELGLEAEAANGRAVLNVLNGGALDVGSAASLDSQGYLRIANRSATLFQHGSEYPKSVDVNPGFDAVLNISGENSSVSVANALIVGDHFREFTGQINVTSGAELNASDAIVQLLEDSELNVSGILTRVALGDVMNLGSTSVRNAAELSVGAIRVGDMDSDGGSLLVSGAGSRVDASGDVQVGYRAFDFTDDGYSGNFPDDFRGQLTIEREAVLSTTGDLIVGGVGPLFDTTQVPESLYPPAHGELRVNSGGRLIANTVFVEEGGFLGGDGGSIEADLVLNGGVFSPGNSPGYTHVGGDILFDTGLLELEYTGPQWGQYDFIHADGAVTFGSDFQVLLSLENLTVPEISLEHFFDVDRFYTLPGFDLASALDLHFGQNIGLDHGEMFTVSFQGQRSQYIYRGSAQAVPELDSLGLPTAFALVLSILALVRERRAPKQPAGWS